MVFFSKSGLPLSTDERISPGRIMEFIGTECENEFQCSIGLIAFLYMHSISAPRSSNCFINAILGTFHSSIMHLRPAVDVVIAVFVVIDVDIVVGIVAIIIVMVVVIVVIVVFVVIIIVVAAPSAATAVVVIVVVDESS